MSAGYSGLWLVALLVQQDEVNDDEDEALLLTLWFLGHKLELNDGIARAFPLPKLPNLRKLLLVFERIPGSCYSFTWFKTKPNN